MGFPVLVNNSYILLLPKYLCASIPHISHFTSFAWVLRGPTALLKYRSKFLQPLSSTLTISATGALQPGPTRCIYLLQNSSLWALSWHTRHSTNSIYHCGLTLMSPQIFTCCHSPLHSQTKPPFIMTVCKFIWARYFLCLLAFQSELQQIHTLFLIFAFQVILSHQTFRLNYLSERGGICCCSPALFRPTGTSSYLF